MTKIKTLEVAPNLVIKFEGYTYSREDLARTVAYWVDFLDELPQDMPMTETNLWSSFSGLAFKLALKISGRCYEIVPCQMPELAEIAKTRRVFLVGNYLGFVWPNGHPSSPDMVWTDHPHHIWKQSRHPRLQDLCIPWRDNQVYSVKTSGSTGQPRAFRQTSYMESLSIDRALQYFSSDDYCVFNKGMAHVGVHTTAVFPAVFSAQTLSFTTPITWFTEIDHATHIQYFPIMQQHWRLPRTCKTITTGGSMLTRDFVRFVLDNCKIDRFLDIYGLTECLPPLAIRNISCEDDVDSFSDWISEDDLPIVENEQLSIQRSDGLVIHTKDLADLDQKRIFIRGRSSQMVRVAGRLLDGKDFDAAFKINTGIYQFAVRYAPDGTATMEVLREDYDRALIWIQKQEAEVQVIAVDHLATSGGIKNIVSSSS